ncbi:MAG TPA: nuclear transport factor 2 family protein [Gammaproteobacteria bacterium]|nr:nuclear transport factor 2 family protein [Gammaproteobacteria bacterium]
MTLVSRARYAAFAMLMSAMAPLCAQAPAVAASADPAAAEVLELEREIGAAVVRGDTKFFDEVTSPDFVMLHGDAWTHGGEPALVDDKASFSRRVASKSYAVLDYEVQAAEMHGGVAITYGRYVGHIPSSPPDRRWFYVWYQKVYAKRAGRWLYLSHRTVDGAHYARDRESLHSARQ